MKKKLHKWCTIIKQKHMIGVIVMRKKENRLARIFSQEIRQDLKKQYQNKIETSIHGELENGILDIFKKLGGVEDKYKFRGHLDLVFEEMVVELDEQLHFNRYRSITLQSNLYEKIPKFPQENYLRYCEEYEHKCLKSGKHGKRWSSPSCDDMFGKSNIKGNLDQNGSSRWKQRAFYDFVKDVSYLATGIPIVRLSIYDNLLVDNTIYLLGEALENEKLTDEILKKGIQQLIDRQL